MYNEQTPQEIEARISRKERIVIIDVREPDEWDSGHIAEAKHIPLGQIARALNEVDPGQETVFVCRSGGRSGKACEYMASLGYKVMNMKGGMSAWTGSLKLGK